MKVGEEVTFTVSSVDGALSWRQDGPDNAGGSFTVDGSEEDEFVSGGWGVLEAVFRAERAGTVLITAEEVMMGPPVCFPPYPELSVVTCTITITEQ